jgi:xanthine dehydrogenase accessory factor
MWRVLVLGIGDIGSAVAHRLFRAGELAAIQDDPRPATSRRRMAFVDAMFEGETQLTGVIARLVSPAKLSPSTWSVRFIPVTATATASAIEKLRPDVIVDARMKKRPHPERFKRLARLTIGLGPGFIAGETVDVAVETDWRNPGRIFRAGAAPASPQAANGSGRERVLYAPGAGLFTSPCDIGDVVRRGEAIGTIGRRAVRAPLAGRLRGLARSSQPVAAGAEIAEIVPAGVDEKIFGIAERPRRIADSVLTLVRELRG